MTNPQALPLAGIRVAEFVHMVMDPTCGMILADLGADVISENFRPGAMDKLGFGCEALRRLNPRLIYCSHKGFLAGPYEHRAALDEVAQMMGGLAYMTGGKGRPMRAGASLNDVIRKESTRAAASYPSLQGCSVC